MDGLKSILSYIEEEAMAQTEGILHEAEAMAQMTKERAQAESEAECSRIHEKALSDEALILERGRSSAELHKKQLLLFARQELISESINDALAQIEALPDEAYFALLLKLYKKHVPEKNAELVFNKRDRERLPKHFLSEAQRLAGENKAEIKLSEETADISSGFIISYGDIEENLSLRALISDSEAQLRERFGSLLFK